jgi:hypothetical protein
VHQIPNPAHGKGKGNTGKKTGDKKGKAAADKAINEARNKNTIRVTPSGTTEETAMQIPREKT